MARRVIHDFVIPARTGRAVEVMEGQVLRIHLVEDKQVGDCAFFNLQDLDDRREAFHVGQSWALNVMLGHGNGKCFKYFYSKPPRENVMFEVVEDTVGEHWSSMGGRCSRRLLELRDGDTDHRSCQENLAEAFAPWGIGRRRHHRCLQRVHERRGQPGRHVRDPSAYRDGRRPYRPSRADGRPRPVSRRVRRIATRPTTGGRSRSELPCSLKTDRPRGRRDSPGAARPRLSRRRRGAHALVGVALRDEPVVGVDVEGRLVGLAGDLDVRGPAAEPLVGPECTGRAPLRRWRGSTASRPPRPPRRGSR